MTRIKGFFPSCIRSGSFEAIRTFNDDTYRLFAIRLIKCCRPKRNTTNEFPYFFRCEISVYNCWAAFFLLLIAIAFSISLIQLCSIPLSLFKKFPFHRAKTVEFDLNNPLSIRSFTGNKTIDVVSVVHKKCQSNQRKNRYKTHRRVKTRCVIGTRCVE